MNEDQKVREHSECYAGVSAGKVVTLAQMLEIGRELAIPGELYSPYHAILGAQDIWMNDYCPRCGSPINWAIVRAASNQKRLGDDE
ncbi:MAG: hypothetical protein H6830_04420 [Planctomycetes bacterium]|nr:hypothetical protein [Planctomycetota bacterium]MCB9910480.1 hypothetical protein [Planctomycetota bacterium]MCB9912606.1 hypothetical protein [Planctomycetota bacterium]HPF15026.1 hypothetical protein [Planctomycetota bacterium]